MGVRRLLTAMVGAVLAVAGLAAPVGALPRGRSGRAATLPVCTIASPEKESGGVFVNGQFENVTWTYSTGVACTANVGDIALYEELDLNGKAVNSKTQGFTGAPKDVAVITATYFCAACNGTWEFKWGQILKAPAGFVFTAPRSGCVLMGGDVYEVCVQTKTVVL